MGSVSIGNLIARSLREEPDDWVEDYRRFSNEKRGAWVEVHRLRAAFHSTTSVAAMVPLTSAEQREIRRAVDWWVNHRNEQRRAEAAMQWEGVAACP